MLPSPFADIPVCTTSIQEKILGAIDDHIKKQPEKIAFLSGEDPSVKITYKDLSDEARRVASFLRESGFGHNHVCCLVLSNCIPFVSCYLGSILCGGIICGINPLLNENELIRMFEDSACRLVVTDEPNLPKILSATKGIPCVKAIICVPNNPQSTSLPADVFNWHTVVKSNITEGRSYNSSCDDVVLLPYSSGTTGLMKGVKLSHKSFSTMMDLLNDHFDRYVVDKLCDRKWNWMDEYTVLMHPFGHLLGTFLLTQTLMKGATGVILKNLETNLLMKTIQKYQIKILIGVPPVLLALVQSSESSKYDLSSLRYVLNSGAAAGKSLCEKFLQKFPSVRFLRQAFAITEAGGATHLPIIDTRENYMNTGALAPIFKQKFVNWETNEEVQLGELGELCIKGPTVMLGYLNKPEATSQAIDKDEWLHTGDIAYLDNKGQLHIVDRLKELIKVGGYQVPPAEIEDIIYSHPSIRDVAVIGIPDEQTGEKPRAYVVVNEAISEKDIIDYVASKIAPYKRLSGGVVFVDAIPRGPTGKILRRILREIQ